MTRDTSQDSRDGFRPSPDGAALDVALLPGQRAAVEDGLARRAMRELHAGEIETLRANGNCAEDWSRVRVSGEFNSESVFHSRFEGSVELGRMGGEAGPCHGAPSGIYHSTLRDCAVGDGVRIARCGLVARQVIGDGACVENVDRMTIRGETADFGNGLVLWDEELFKRRVRAVAELPFEWAAWLSGPDASAADERLKEGFDEAAGMYAARMRSGRGYVGRGVRIVSAAVIEDCWFGEKVEIEAAGTMRNCTLWADAGAPTTVRDGVHARNCLIGPGCLVERGATIEDSIFFEQVFVGQQAIVRGCAIGPNSRLSASEANDSLLGPFTMAIHHGLILAAWWPEGKGNIAYGSNVGSNHTGRAPDQEIWPGEGVFFGLGCSVKFPCNFREAPYTIIASGVNILPQRVGFPFSLIMPPTRAVDKISPALNEIQPGWGLLCNAYGIERHERNMAQRLCARRQMVDTRILRGEFVSLIERALEALKNPEGGGRDIYTEKQVPGLGKNFMTEEARRQGIEAYEFGLKIIAARELRGGSRSASMSVEETDGAMTRLKISPKDPEAIGKIMVVERKWLAKVVESRERDDIRGNEIIDDYPSRHREAMNDPTIEALKEELLKFEVAGRWMLSAVGE